MKVLASIDLCVREHLLHDERKGEGQHDRPPVSDPESEETHGRAHDDEEGSQEDLEVDIVKEKNEYSKSHEEHGPRDQRGNKSVHYPILLTYSDSL